MYDISDKNIKVEVYFNSKYDHLIGIGTIHKIDLDDCGEMHISTILINGKIYCRAGLGIKKIEERNG